MSTPPVSRIQQTVRSRETQVRRTPFWDPYEKRIRLVPTDRAHGARFRWLEVPDDPNSQRLEGDYYEAGKGWVRYGNFDAEANAAYRAFVAEALEASAKLGREEPDWARRYPPQDDKASK